MEKTEVQHENTNETSGGREQREERPGSQGKRSHGERRFSIVEVPGDPSENSAGGEVKAWLGWAQENGMKVLGK